MRPWTRILLGCGTITAIALATSAFVWSSVPDPMPIHWDASGHPNGWASRTFALLFSPLLGVALSALVGGVLARDEKTRKFAAYFAIATSAFTLGLHLLIVQAAFHPGGVLAMGGMSILLGLFFAGLGVMMPRLPPNRWAGIRLPWTMKDEVVWKLTHELGGKMFVGAGAVAAITGVLLPAPWSFVALMGAIFIATIVPIVYSYLLYRARQQRG